MSLSNTPPQQTPKIILIDDDPSFGHIMKQYAAKRGLELDHFESLEQLGFVALLDRYDLAILDYDLGGMTGEEIGGYLSALFTHKPMLLISSTMRKPVLSKAPGGTFLPFLLKGRNYELILSTALALDATMKEQRHLLLNDLSPKDMEAESL